MSLKRKLSIDFDDEVEYSSAKRPNRIPFPGASTMDVDMDVNMSDASSDTDLLTPLSIPDYPFHTRLPSNASTISSLSSSIENSPTSSHHDMLTDAPTYFTSSPANYSPKAVGLIQPKGSSFTHHGNCSQIPKLRMACAPGLNGQRAMWALCEECGAIEMVNTD